MVVKHPERQIDADEFAARCRALVDEVAATGEAIVITDDGNPIARIEPVDEGWMSLRGSLVWQADDIISPIDEAEWDTEAC